MSPIDAWAKRHGISPAALADLRNTLGVKTIAPPPPQDVGKTEAYAQSLVRLEAPAFDVLAFRNNVGVLEDKNGRPVRYGLANDSKQMNETFKSGDLIGIRRVLITAAHVGSTIGQFVSRECKRPGWKYAGTGREPAQLAWADLINSYGGDAKFATGKGSFDR